MYYINNPLYTNKLESYEDLSKSLIDILNATEKHLSKDGSGLSVSAQHASYSPRVSMMEGWARMLWGIAPLVNSGQTWNGQSLHKNGFINGSDPNSQMYWGQVPGIDQRMVEMAPISLSLLLAPDIYWNPLSEKQKNNLYNWLNDINLNSVPNNNWMCFRVLVNLAFKKLGREYNKELLEEDLIAIENLYFGDGWYKDKDTFDNYNPFAIHYYLLIYYRFMKDEDIDRCKRIKERASIFCSQYINMFNSDGSNVPFGRSLVYRFAAVSFFSALVFANIKVVEWGVIKGIILRSLRWWFNKPIFDNEGLLTIGYAYPTNLFAEGYNGPGSPYWCLKVYLLLAVDKGHEFWSSKELPLPKKAESKTFLPIPHIIVQRTGDDVVILNNGQNPSFQMNHVDQKYKKFAYSSHYGFSASLSNDSFEKTGCDSMLYFVDQDGYYRGRKSVEILRDSPNMLISKWKCYSANVISYLIPLNQGHIRVHYINSKEEYKVIESGFAIPRYQGIDSLPPKTIIDNNAKYCKIVNDYATSLSYDLNNNRVGKAYSPKPNLNLINSTTLVASLEGQVSKGITVLAGYFDSSNKVNEEINIIFDRDEFSLKIDELLIRLPRFIED